MKPRIAVLFHKNTKRHLIKKYEIHLMAMHWREEGYNVTYLFGTSQYIPAEVCIVHVDLSVVPDDYLEFANHYPIVLNGRVKDIRKRATSNLILENDRDYHGPVIVKTDLNFAGWPERTLTYNMLSLSVLKAASWLGINSGVILTHRNYAVFERVSQVPARYRNDRHYVIEKFLPEIRDGLYCVNYYKFFGARFECTRRYSRDPVVISANTIRSIEIEVNPAVVRASKHFGLDFGKIDYCMHEGVAVILDINKTPGRRTRKSNVPQQHVLRRAEGLYGFIEQNRSMQSPM